jgi:methionyl-tRNA formyltransferase
MGLSEQAKGLLHKAIVYLGTPAFAVPTLEAILAAGDRVLEVVTQPDRPKGRQQTLTPSPVKLFALAHGLPVYQPERVRRPEAVEHLRALAPDVMVIVGYGQIIPQSIIDIPRHGIINVHASLLPKLRGAAPIQWSIVRGDHVTGVTTMRIDAGLDTGDMLMRAETEIAPDETAVELGERLSRMGAKLLVETLARIDSIVPEKQNNNDATLAPILKKEDGRIDWTRPALDIHNLIRGLQPWPSGHTTFRGSLLQIWKARVSRLRSSAPAGQLLPEAHSVVCGDASVLELLEVQLEGRKRIVARDFLNGFRLTENEFLGATPR